MVSKDKKVCLHLRSQLNSNLNNKNSISIMKEQLLQILQEVAKGIKSPEVAQAEILTLRDTFKPYDIPIWLEESDFIAAKVLYKENRLRGVKYLYCIAKPYIKNNCLSWSDDFLKAHTIN